ncbi:hypothetical protein [Collimonas fungivorans]|uniref:hypothetical protein n=1 Tax=Collimonas fungivorans TaxID=158899 RepID=UPI0005A037F9|nr:hypothetical protein [Collimonas fungivorans]
MDINSYLAKQYSAQPCWELVADVYDRELQAIAVGYKTVNRSIREMAGAFRIAIHKTAHGFEKIDIPVDLCIVLLGKTEVMGIHHCGIYFQGKVLHAMPESTLYEELSVIKDRYSVVEFWAK